MKLLEYVVTKRDDWVLPLCHVDLWIFTLTYLAFVLALILFASRKRESYLVLNAASKNHKMESEARRERMRTGAFPAVVIGIISELLGVRISEWIAALF